MSPRLALLLLVVAAGGLAGASGATTAPGEERIVFASEWGGPTQVYATSPAIPARVTQITFDRVPPTCVHVAVACGLSEPVPSPDGRRLVYRTAGDVLEGGQFAASYWIARADGRAARRLPGVAVTLVPASASMRPVWARRLTTDAGTSLSWAPGRALLAYVLPRAVDGAAFQEIRTVTPAGKVRVVVPATGAYGGQLAGFGWLRPAAGMRFREPEPVEGVYAGGRITRLTTDGGAAAMVSCGRVLVWRPPGALLRVDDRAGAACSDGDRANIPQALALAGGRVAYQVTNVGLGYLWELVLATATGPVQRTRLASGWGNLGRTPDGAAGSGSLLAYSSYPGGAGTEQALYRVEPDGSSTRIKTEPVGEFGAAPLDPVDADAGRILTRSSRDFLRVLDGDGRTLLAIYVVPDAAALSGNDVVAVAGGELRDYDATTGAVVRAWPAGDLLRGHGYVDTAHGLAAYTTASGEARVRRLADGREAVVGRGAMARFLDGGLAIADGARVRVVPDARLDALLASAPATG